MRDVLGGRRVIVTGGASGMGAGLVRSLPSYGAKVASLDLNESDGRAVTEGSPTSFIRCDITDRQSVLDAVEVATQELGGLDVLVHCAGTAPRGSAADTTLEQWNFALAVNATGTMLTNQAVLPHLSRAGGGRIINFASAAGLIGYPAKAAYAASKGAVLAWTRTIATDWAQHGITVNAVSPAIRTPMYERTRAGMTSEELGTHDAFLRATIPLGGQMGDVDRDLVPVIVFLASEGSGFMTGQTFSVDGGQVMVR